MRNIPLLGKWYTTQQEAPLLFALGFAAYLYLLKSTLNGNQYEQLINGRTILLQDESAPKLYAAWINPDKLVHTVLSDTDLWGINLTEFPHFEETVNQKLQQIIEEGALKALEISSVPDNKKV